MCKALAEIGRKLGPRMNTNGFQEVILISISCLSVKIKEIER